MLFNSTKSYYNLPCSHQKWMDEDSDGNVGKDACAKKHGYSREFDDYGWVIGFASLKKVKAWLDFMFDHTSLWEASDPRLDKVKTFQDELSIYEMRILPTGVSMEQSAF